MTPKNSHHPLPVFSSKTTIDSLGDSIGWGGAEFRVSLLIRLFGFGVLEAITLLISAVKMCRHSFNQRIKD